MKYSFSVSDMNCGHCKRHIEDALKESTSIASFDVDLPAKKVTVESSLAADAIAALITEAGYTPILA